MAGPSSSAVWFLAREDTIRISLNTSRQKVRNLRRNLAVTFFLLDRAAPTRYLEVRGDAELRDDPDYEFASEVGTKYGVDLRTFDAADQGRVVVTVHPVRVNAVDMAAGG